MSRIETLIEEFCPDGVEFRPMGEVGVLVRGNGMPKTDFTEEGIGCIHYGQVYTHFRTWAKDTKSFVLPAVAAKLAKVDPGDLVITNTSENVEDVCKAVAWLGDAQVVTGGHATVFKHQQDPKFLSYYLQTAEFFAKKKKHATGTKVIDVSANSLAKIEIPVPPLEVQREIVRILDTFTELEAELEAGLEAELEARRRQFEHYRDTMLGFRGREDVPWVSLREVGTFLRGRRFTKADYVDSGIPAIHYGDVYTRYGTSTVSAVSHLRRDLGTPLRYAAPGDVVLVDVGETVDDVGKAVAWLGAEPVAIHDHCYAFRHTMDPTFVSYVLQTASLRAERAKYVARTKVKTLMIDGFSRIEVPVPSAQEQAAIVSALDAFDTLVNDLSVGLPAELAARRKQYEYYRDRLLSFEELRP